MSLGVWPTDIYDICSVYCSSAFFNGVFKKGRKNPSEKSPTSNPRTYLVVPEK